MGWERWEVVGLGKWPTLRIAGPLPPLPTLPPPQVAFFATLPDHEKVQVLSAMCPRRLPTWRAGKGGGKVAAFTHLGEQEKADALNDMLIPGAPVFTAKNGPPPFHLTYSLPNV